MSTASFHFFNQPLAYRFGTVLRESLVESEWRSFEAAVAWVRQSGTRHLESAFVSFLERGGSAVFSVGLDSRNTSREGLESLLQLKRAGDVKVYVYHNESNVIYHPKVYLLSNADRARLIVGSNNLTEAGLFRNTEAGLQVDSNANDVAIVQAKEALAAWRDVNSTFVRQLDTALLEDLVGRKYLWPEAALRREQARKQREASERLFGHQGVSVPPIPGERALRLRPDATGTVLLMRVRRASETERRTQVQIPIRVVNTGFFGDDAAVTSNHDDRIHTLRRARARGATNTIKLELPEIDPMSDPVVRFERREDGISYQVHDSSSPMGRAIMESLESGLTLDPPVTLLTVPASPNSSTWWRFV